MKGRFKSAGIPVATGRVVATADEAKELVKKTGYPAVIKPDVGVGALDTFLINNGEDLDTFFANTLDVDYIMEEFVQGSIYSFDGHVTGQETQMIEVKERGSRSNRPNRPLRTFRAMTSCDMEL